MSHQYNETSWAALRQLLVDHYDDLRRRLTRRLGSDDLARETLHELYLRMDRSGSAGTLIRPSTYLLTSAVNLARDRWRTENRRARRVTVDALYDLIDENPGPDRTVEAQSEFEAFNRALARLTPRQRTIVVAVQFEQLSRSEIAKRLDISRSLVQLELQRALELCEIFLEKNCS
ncbi:RNA polymerase sigma factor [Tardiphaga sp.]|uniref:RNA polymerase sigma factor n=1 Tax=Tardiphaga sp. TaxID=1926292 RepID=UPI00352A822B